MGLKDYASKRNFQKTSEPAPAKAKPGERIFVVQKHYATSAHYDLRLRLGDVLRSWAVPKGPSLDPKEKRLAVEVEDHPVDYASFEGVIPEGYGAGTVMVWDEGLWSPANGDPAKALKDGELKFNLEGQRLKGRWVLVRTAKPARQPQWLLIKERDRDATPGVNAETYPTSVVTGRTMDEIAAGAPARKARAAPTKVAGAADLKGARTAPMPGRVRPQLAVPADSPPEGDAWLHEVKFDGYRLVIHRKGDAVKILSRRGLDWTAKLPDLAAAVRERLAVDAVLDGEAVLLDSRGVSDFQALQNAIHSRRSRSIVYIAFDLPWCDGHDLTRVTLEHRRGLLAALVGTRQEGRLRLSEHIVGSGRAAFERACAAGLEGIVSKKRSAPYAESRTPTWVKVKCFNQQEFVIGGFTAPEGTREQFGSLLIGYFEGGRLRFAGKVGTGFSTETLRSMAARLTGLVQAKPAFANPPTGAEARGVTWVRPELVAQVQFRDWTGEGVIRHPSFRGLREDIEPGSVGRETAQAAAERSEPPPAKKTAAKEPAAPAARFTNLDRIVYPDRGAGFALTKRQVLQYYEAAAPLMLPHVADRALSILRCPTGEGGKSFFQKHPVKGMPGAVNGVDVPEDDGTMDRHLCIHDVEGLLGLAQMNVLEFHPWGSRAGTLEEPDRLIFDLDPGAGVSWRQIVQAAGLVREALAQMKLMAFARVSGGKGVHLVVPLRPGHTWPQVKAFCKAAAETLVRLAPRQFVATPGAANRQGRIFIDYLRNVRGATAIGSYSTRARPAGPIALPVSWDELPALESAGAFTIPAVLRRLAAGAPDPWRKLDQSGGVLRTERASL